MRSRSLLTLESEVIREIDSIATKKTQCMNTLPYKAIIKTFAYFPVYDMYEQQELFPIKMRTLFEMDTIDSLPPLAVCFEKEAVCSISQAKIIHFSKGLCLYYSFNE